MCVFNLVDVHVTHLVPVVTQASDKCRVKSHDHTSIIMETPAGIGVNREVMVQLHEGGGGGSRSSEVIYFSYDPPVIEQVIPNRANALGEPTIQVRSAAAPAITLSLLTRCLLSTSGVGY